MTKAQMIRSVDNDSSFAMTNQMVKDEVRRRWGAAVSSSEIINCLGAFHKRLEIQGYSDLLLEHAQNYLTLVGDLHLAKTLLAKVVHDV
jgi:hypothetical protein